MQTQHVVANEDNAPKYGGSPLDFRPFGMGGVNNYFLIGIKLRDILS